MAAASERFSLTAVDLQDGKVLMNGVPLDLGPNDELPVFRSFSTPAGPIEFAPASITFLYIPSAGNPACR